MGTLRHSAEGAVGRGLSPAIWQAYGFIGGNFGDPSRTPFFFDDFAAVPVFTTNATNVLANGYRTFQSDGVTIQACAAADNSEGEFGILEIAGNDADNDEGYLELGAGKSGLVRIDPTAGERAVVAMEFRFKKASVADNALAIALGLGEPGFAATGGLANNTGALADKDFVGFQTLHASGEEVDTIYRKSGGSVVQVKDNAATMEADTWHKLGLVYDPNAAANKKMKFFFDGVELGDSVTDAIIEAGTAFPTDEELTPVLLAKVGAAAESKAYADWLAIGMYPTDV
jgi:hypothetical protein